MGEQFLSDLFALDGQVAIVTGGSGVLGGAIADGLARAGARVAVIGRNAERANAAVERITAAGGESIAVTGDVVNRDEMRAARDEIVSRWGTVDILVNGAGGNIPGASTTDDRTFFDLEEDAWRAVVDLNLYGTVFPSQVFGEVMAQKGRGSIVNISSMAVPSALTRLAGYSAGKAAAENFTRWLAVEFARRYGAGLRVNAIAPGFFVAEQNRNLLLTADGSPTERGRSILAGTPMGRFGEADELVSAVIWLCGPGASFISGVVVPIDGGFSAFAGV
jgi:NAD(P)-dependent dehydrogenase (short-subunit alcohol dehydrogenase family)